MNGRVVNINFCVVIALDDHEDDEAARNAADMVAMTMLERTNQALSDDADNEWPRGARRVMWTGRGKKVRSITSERLARMTSVIL